MKKCIYFLLIVLIIAGCKEKYDLPFIPPVKGYLVIEGIIVSGDITQIELSRANNIDAGRKQYEFGAMVTVEGSDNNSYILYEQAAGYYSNQFILDNSSQYRLRIKTTDGQEYLSDFVDVKNTPNIDSIGWKQESGGVRLFVNTHDPQNNTHYFYWTYDETWEIHSAFQSTLKYVFDPSGKPGIVFRDPRTGDYDSTIYKCWNSASSTNILIGSTARLSNDVVSEQPFLFIPDGDRRLSVRYSVNVKQFAITKEAFEFLDKMKKNTEQNGTIFDPQPSQLKGNIQCVTTPAEMVIGYVMASVPVTKRQFINADDVPFWRYLSGCVEQKIPNNADSIDVAVKQDLFPTITLPPYGPSILFFGVSNMSCIDCTLTGTNVKPSYWP